MQLGAYGTMKESVLRLIDGFAQIQPPGYADDPDLRKTIADPAALMATARQIAGGDGERAARARAMSSSRTVRAAMARAVFGIDPARETKVSTLGDDHRRRPLSRSRATPTPWLIGAGLARNLKLSIGSKLTMLGGARDGSIAADVLKRAGIFSTGAPELDRQVIEMPLARFQIRLRAWRAASTPLPWRAISWPTSRQACPALRGVARKARPRRARLDRARAGPA